MRHLWQVSSGHIQVMSLLRPDPASFKGEGALQTASGLDVHHGEASSWEFQVVGVEQCWAPVTPVFPNCRGEEAADCNAPGRGEEQQSSAR